MSRAHFLILSGIAGICVACLVVRVAFFSETQPTREEFLNPSGDTVMCPMDVLRCSDGSFVGRQGPRCTFVPCPN